MYSLSFWVLQEASFSGAQLLDYLEESELFELKSDGHGPVRYQYYHKDTFCRFNLFYSPARIREEQGRFAPYRFTGVYTEVPYGQPEFTVYEMALILSQICEHFGFWVEDPQIKSQPMAFEAKPFTQTWERVNEEVLRRLKTAQGLEGNLLNRQRMMQWWVHGYFRGDFAEKEGEEWTLPRLYLLGNEKWKDVRRAVVFQPEHNLLIPDCEMAIIMSTEMDPPMMGILPIRDLWSLIQPYVRVGFTHRDPLSEVKVRYKRYLAQEPDLLRHRLSNTPMLDPDDFFRINGESLVSRK